MLLAQVGVGTPDSSTIHRTLNRMDAEALDQALAVWTRTRTSPTVVAVDGKEVRGAKNGGGTTVRLLSALKHEALVVLAQVEVGAKSNEIPMFPVLLEQIQDVGGMVVTADALHANAPTRLTCTNVAPTTWSRSRATSRPCTTSCSACRGLQVPAGHRQQERTRGKITIRTTKAVAIEAGIDFPRAAQAVQLIRWSHPATGGPWRTEVTYAVTSVPAHG